MRQVKTGKNGKVNAIVLQYTAIQNTNNFSSLENLRRLCDMNLWEHN
jgi:hypothetical protein